MTPPKKRPASQRLPLSPNPAPERAGKKVQVSLRPSRDEVVTEEVLRTLGLESDEAARVAEQLRTAEPRILEALAKDPERLARFTADPLTVAAEIAPEIERGASPANPAPPPSPNVFTVIVDLPVGRVITESDELMLRVLAKATESEAATASFPTNFHQVVQAERQGATQEDFDSVVRAFEKVYGIRHRDVIADLTQAVQVTLKRGNPPLRPLTPEA